jgi:hypothetical protein
MTKNPSMIRKPAVVEMQKNWMDMWTDISTKMMLRTAMRSCVHPGFRRSLIIDKIATALLSVDWS